MAVVEFLDLIVVAAGNDLGICLLVSADQAEDQGLEALAVGRIGIDEAAELRSGDDDFQIVRRAELLEGVGDIVAVSAGLIQFLEAFCQNVFFIADIKGSEKEVIDQTDDEQGDGHGRNEGVGDPFFDGVLAAAFWLFQVKMVFFSGLLFRSGFYWIFNWIFDLFFCFTHCPSASNL